MKSTRKRKKSSGPFTGFNFTAGQILIIILYVLYSHCKSTLYSLPIAPWGIEGGGGDHFVCRTWKSKFEEYTVVLEVVHVKIDIVEVLGLLVNGQTRKQGHLPLLSALGWRPCCAVGQALREVVISEGCRGFPLGLSSIGAWCAPRGLLLQYTLVCKVMLMCYAVRSGPLRCSGCEIWFKCVKQVSGVDGPVPAQKIHAIERVKDASVIV